MHTACPTKKPRALIFFNVILYGKMTGKTYGKTATSSTNTTLDADPNYIETYVVATCNKQKILFNFAGWLPIDRFRGYCRL